MRDWIIVKESKFRRQYKRLGGPRQARVDLAIRDLSTSDDPAGMGRLKKPLGAFAYNIDKSDRLIYMIDSDLHNLILLRVCDHKSVYGTD